SEDEPLHAHTPGALDIFLHVVDIEDLVPPHVEPLEYGVVNAFFWFFRAHLEGEYPFVHEVDDGITLYNMGEVELIGIAEEEQGNAPCLEVDDYFVHLKVLLEDIVPYLPEFLE